MKNRFSASLVASGVETALSADMVPVIYPGSLKLFGALVDFEFLMTNDFVQK
ncbi:hypothetical protein [Owenweeksia hongkongensis]|uniref:hypothetical protein n=1 Tax=Owenweeksia hongkongensis TaxID=253245 RepID=UPI00145D64DD|nr:hypothetical protein [Owenweeksia hongkongensis]